MRVGAYAGRVNPYFACFSPAARRLKAGFVALLLALVSPLAAEVLPNPAITASFTSQNGAVANVFDNRAEDGEYRSRSGGANTYISFDFGMPVTVDGFVNVTRNSTSSVVTSCRLIFDTDGTTGFNAATDTVVNFSAGQIGWLGQGYVNRFAPVTARRVRWEVTAAAGSSGSTGAMEMRFLTTPENTTPVTGVGVTGGSPALNSEHQLANAANGLAGRRPTDTAGQIPTPSVGYKSNGAGTNTYVDFDLGQIRPVTGFDWFDNLATSDRVNAFTLTFANDPGFAAPVAVKSYSGNSGFSLSDAFAPVAARYVRYRVTGAATASPGLSELIFYQGPGDGLPTAFSADANPANNWLHGEKATPQASDLTAFDAAAAADPEAPCDRWYDSESTTSFAGRAPANALSTEWGGVDTEWAAGSLYHAWRDEHPFAITSRFTVTETSAYNLDAIWTSHTTVGCQATVWLVVDGITVASGVIDGFAGTGHGTPQPAGTSPTASCQALGLYLTAGSRVDLVTQPVSAVGNLALTANLAKTTVAAERTDTVLIREFLASNQSGIQDEDGERQDWIEIYNGTGVAVDLDGWSLTDRADRPDLWRFPPRVLPHGARLLVFASGKDATKRPDYGPNSELHANFSLAAAGEFLGLADLDGNYVSEFGPVYPPQIADISHGTGSNGVTGYMHPPTPGAPNGEASAEPPALLSFSQPSGLFSGSLGVTISGQSPAHTVRYTTNGSEPSPANGATYTGPLTITSGTTLRARAFSDGVGGPLAQATYTPLGTTTNYGIDPATFASSLPLLVIDAASEPPTSRTPIPARFTVIDRQPSTGTARLTDPPVLATRGSIKLRGQSSAGLAKKPYGIEFWDAAGESANLPLLGMAAESDWALYASYQFDPNFLRNVLMFELYRRMGRWAPSTRFVEVFFNTSASDSIHGGSYRGVYVLMENVKVGRNRVNITRMTASDNSGDALTGGYIIARDKWLNSAELMGGNSNYFPNWLHASGGSFVFKRPRYDLITAAQKAYITNHTMECDTAVARPDRRHPVTGLHIFDYLDTPSFIDHHMLNAFAKNVDGIRISTFLEKERLGRLAMSSVWDFDRSQDSDTDGRDDNPWAWNSDDASGSSTDFFSVDGRTAEGWFHHLHQIPAYLQAWVDRYDEVRATGVFDMAAISGLLGERAAELTARDNNGTAGADTPIARNFGRWPRNTRGVGTNGGNAESIIFGPASNSEINRQKTWLTQRISLMDSWVLRKPVASLAPGTVAAGSVLNLTSPDLTGGAAIHYTLDGTDPWAPDGSIVPGALTWSGPLPLNHSAILVARLRNPSAFNKHTAWSAPLRAVYFVEGQTELGVHQWDFEHPVDYLLPSHTYLDASLRITPGPTTTVERNTAAQDFDSAHLRVNEPLGATLELALPTSGFQFASLSWLTRRSTQGAGTHIVEYTTDGITWTQMETYAVENAAPQARSFDFTAVPAVSDNPDFAVRVTFAQGGGGMGGTNRFDNITLTAVPLPGNNLPPHVQAPPANRVLIEGGAGATVNLAAVFADPNNDPLVFGASSGHPGALEVALSGSLLTLTPLGRGESTVTLTASDGNNSPVAATFRVLVHPAAHVLVTDPYPFGAWPADSPAGAFPYNMIFLQGEQNDSTLATTLERAYHIPPDSAAAPEDVAFPYAASSRTRINGLGADGISFINTGRGRDLGGALLALNTNGLDAARLGFTTATLAPNSRSYAIRLQYRLGIEGPFTDLPGPDGQPVEYHSAATAGHSTTFGPVALPPEALNQPYVQLVWRYYLTGGDSGPRAQLRLDDILVTADMDTAPAGFVFGPTPQSAQSGAPVPPIAVTLVDGSGFTASGFSGPVAISLAGAGTLGGTATLNAIEGAAVFDDLFIIGAGLTQLSVSAAGLDPVPLPVFRTLALTEMAVPRFIQGGMNDTGINDQRLPCAWLARIDGLQPGATYRFANRVALPADPPANNGAGNMIFITGTDSGWLRSSASPDFHPDAVGSGHYSFTAAANGSHTAWFVTEPTGNPRFTPGHSVHFRLLLNDGADGTDTAFTLTTAQTATVVRLGSGLDEASGVIGSSFTPGRRIAVLFDSADGSNRPLTATPVETTGAGATDLYASFYQDQVATNDGVWGTLLPNQLPWGLRRMEIRSVTDGALIYPLVAADGFTGTVAGAPASSVNPANGLTPLILLTPAEPGRFDQWRARHFTPPADFADPAVSGPHADPSGAGVPNLLRHALGVGPLDPVAHLLPTLSQAGDSSLRFLFRYDPAKTDLTWRVLASPDLVDWTHVLFDSATDAIPPRDDGWLPVAVPPTLGTDPQADPGMFLRLEVETASP